MSAPADPCSCPPDLHALVEAGPWEKVVERFGPGAAFYRLGERWHLHACPLVGRKPAWVPCEACEDFLCTVHPGLHVHECPCPPVEEWLERGLDPYSEGGIEVSDPEPHEDHGIVHELD